MARGQTSLLHGLAPCWGEATTSNSGYGESIEERFAARFFALTVVLEQELAAWTDFALKADPGFGRHDCKAFYHPGWSESNSEDAVDACYMAACDFFATRHLAAEVAGQVN